MLLLAGRFRFDPRGTCCLETANRRELSVSDGSSTSMVSSTAIRTAASITTQVRQATTSHESRNFRSMHIIMVNLFRPCGLWWSSSSCVQQQGMQCSRIIRMGAEAPAQAGGQGLRVSCASLCLNYETVWCMVGVRYFNIYIYIYISYNSSCGKGLHATIEYAPHKSNYFEPEAYVQYCIYIYHIIYTY